MKRALRHTLVFGLLAVLAAASASFGSAAVGHALTAGPGSPSAFHHDEDCRACQSASQGFALAPAVAESWTWCPARPALLARAAVVRPRPGHSADAARAPPLPLVT